jgi:hypothetical protein
VSATLNSGGYLVEKLQHGPEGCDIVRPHRIREGAVQRLKSRIDVSALEESSRSLQLGIGHKPIMTYVGADRIDPLQPWQGLIL